VKGDPENDREPFLRNYWKATLGLEDQQ